MKRWQDMTPEEISALPLGPTAGKSVIIKNYALDDPIAAYDAAGHAWTICSYEDGSHYRFRAFF